MKETTSLVYININNKGRKEWREKEKKGGRKGGRKTVLKEQLLME